MHEPREIPAPEHQPPGRSGNTGWRDLRHPERKADQDLPPYEPESVRAGSSGGRWAASGVQRAQTDPTTQSGHMLWRTGLKLQKSDCNDRTDARHGWSADACSLQTKKKTMTIQVRTESNRKIQSRQTLAQKHAFPPEWHRPAAGEPPYQEAIWTGPTDCTPLSRRVRGTDVEIILPRITKTEVTPWTRSRRGRRQWPLETKSIQKPTILILCCAAGS